MRAATIPTTESISFLWCALVTRLEETGRGLRTIASIFEGGEAGSIHSVQLYGGHYLDGSKLGPPGSGLGVSAGAAEAVGTDGVDGAKGTFSSTGGFSSC